MDPCNIKACKAYKAAAVQDAGGKTRRVIVTLEVPADARHNMDRAGVVNKLTAKHRVDRAFVCEIRDADGNEYACASSMYHVPVISYHTGQVVQEHEYEKGDRVCAPGIHVFLTRRVAEQYLNKPYDGLYEKYYDNGQMDVQIEYKYGMQHGPYKSWYCNGVPNFFGEYEHGSPVGTHRLWNCKGELQSEKSYG